MASLQKLLARVIAQLRELTLSQRLAILLGAALIGGSLAWMVQWAASSEMVPLLGQGLDADDLVLVQTGLDATGQPYQVVGSRILVPASADRPRILALLQQQQKLPSDTSVSFSALVAESNPWISQKENDRRWSVALAHELERVLTQLTDVKTAKVFLNLSTGRARFTRSQPETTASVTLIMDGAEPVSRALAMAAARLVAGAVQGLSPRNVSVVDGGTGRSAVDWEIEEDGAPSKLHRLRREHEKRLAAKITNQLADPAARVNVQVEMELATRTQHATLPSEPVELETETTSDTTRRVRAGDQPGVQPNVGVEAQVAAGGGESSEKTTNRTSFQPGQTTTSETTPPGRIKESFAAINISYSYLASIAARLKPDGGAPSEAEILAIFDTEKSKVVNQVTALVKPQSEEQVRVDWYYDVIEPQEPAQAGVLDDPLTLARDYGPQAGLGLLALVSMGLMLRMARRSSGETIGLEIGLPKEAIAAARKAARDARRAAQAESFEQVQESSASQVDQAQPSEALLVAQEVGEDTVHLNKMMEQVQELIGQDPSVVTSVIESWIDQRD